MQTTLDELRQQTIAHLYGWRGMDIPAINGGLADRYQSAWSVRLPYAPASYATEWRPETTSRARLWQLDTDLPFRLCSVGDWVGGRGPGVALDAARRLALLLKYGGAPLRWEPLNDYRLHRAIASPRSLFSCAIYLVQQKDGTPARAWRYLPDYHALAVVDAVPGADLDAALPGTDAMRLVVVGHLDRMARPYGELVSALVGPEAGMLGAQLALVAKALGWNSTTRAAFDAGALGAALNLSHWSALPLAVLTLDDPALATLAPAALRDCVIAEPSDETAETERLPMLRRLVALSRLDEPGQAAAAAQRIADRRGTPPAPRAALVDDEDMLAVMRRRSSGRLERGYVAVGIHLDRDMLDQLVALWHGLHVLQGDSELRAVRVRPFLSVLRCRGARPGVYELDLADGTLRTHLAGDQRKALADAGAPPTNFNEMNLVVSLVVDYGAELEAMGERGYLLVQQAVGALAHCFSLAAARHDLFSRPYKSYESQRVESALNLPGQVVLQLMAGAARCCNTAYELL